MENFVVSARKYRPQTFASVVGQRHITSTLKNAIERGQLAHAYLFCGPRGVGKTTCARIFAKAINCLNPQSGEACNECESCRSFNEGRSLNVHELDAASNNSVDDIRNLIEQVRIIPQQGRYSVFVIDEVHMLSAAAFNAFLKTLEEPPQHAIFILATTEKHKIIPTILSRCQIYDFNRIRVEDGVDYLRHIASQEGVEADDEALNLISHKADGGMRDALSMFDKAVSFCGTKLSYKDVAATLNVLDYDTYFTTTDLLLEGRYVDVLVLFDEVLSRGFSPQVFTTGLNAHMRDLLMAKGPAISLVEFTGTLVERYKQQAARCDESFLFNAMSLLTEADGRLRQASNQRLFVELGLMKIAGLGQKKNDEALTPMFETNFPLPELTPQAASVAATPQVAPVAAQPQVAPAMTQPQAVSTPQSVAQSVSQPAMQPMAHTVQHSAPQPTAQPTVQATTQRVQTAAQSRPQASRTVAKPKLGLSINVLMGGEAKTASEEAAAAAAAAAVEVVIDPRSEEKLVAAKPKMLEILSSGRVRYIPVFNTMRAVGNVVHLTVASRELFEEIMRDKLRWLGEIADVSGVNGVLELEVTINEAIKIARPITIEDRLKHLIARNDKLREMIEQLVLDAE
ncbi:MAG: DNA polymerase III subunit gamma/tau [Alistipes sp.]|nr:DNA polymerase III subunit gamma/tau [Alistipes sp.]